MRLFIAIDLSESARALVAAEQHRLSSKAAGRLRFVPYDQLHVTLAFMGFVEPAEAERISEAVERGFDVRPFTLAFGGLGVLPHPRKPRVLYVGVREGKDHVVALQRLVAARLGECGIELERLAFRPHLTLARWREPDASSAGLLLASGGRERLAEQEVAGLTLYESRLSPGGATHVAVAMGRFAREPRGDVRH